MASAMCPGCRHTLRQSLRSPNRQLSNLTRTGPSRRSSSSSSSSPPTNIRNILSKPTWSVRSLLPPSSSSHNAASPPPSSPITPKTLHHLLRLSALLQPASPEEEASMLQTLSSQLHFVRAIQSVDTAGVEPLRAIRDETAVGMREQTIGLDSLRDALAKEDVLGRARRPRRRRNLNEEEKEAAKRVEDWDVLGGAGMTAGRYFVVRSGKGVQSNSVG